MSIYLAAAAAAPPGDTTVVLPFTEINWWLFAILLFVIFVGLRLAKQKWAGPAAATMLGFAIVYALFMRYVLPLLNL